MSGEDELRQCGKCGGELNDIEWLFDPCPEDEDGEHGNPAPSLAARLRHGYRTARGTVRGWVVHVLEVTGIAALARKIAATRGGRVALAVWRFAWGHTPRWLRRCIGIALLVPGPQDEAVAGVALLLWLGVLLGVSAGARSELAGSVRGAWRGNSQAPGT